MSRLSGKISRPVDEIGSHYEVVVIGSGYGGAIAASRMARAGRDVCLLERGDEIRPGEYPDTLTGGAAQIQANTPLGRYGSPTGMFEFHVNPDVNALVGCGLGGTSLINANVSLEARPEVFDREQWPLRYEDLEPYYKRASRMLGATPYPERFPRLNKLDALAASARAMKQPFYRPPINVTFEDGPNAAGVHQRACNLCGDCCSGCNYDAKNTTLMNYLPDAVAHGAKLFTRARVLDIGRDGQGKWNVRLENPAADAGEPVAVTAEIVFLCAGALGSTEILLRSRTRRDLSLSSAVGGRFSGNGDALGFGYNNYWRVEEGQPPVPEAIYGIGRGSNPAAADTSPGPCITGIIDMRDSENLDDAMVIEEGVIPGLVASVLPPTMFFSDALEGNFLKYGLNQAESRLKDAQNLGEAIQNNPGSLASHSYSGPVARTQTYLVMSHDDASGDLRLENDRIRIHWPRAGRSPVIKRDNDMMKAATDAIQGQYISNPIWDVAYGEQIITVHPVGGCIMAEDGNSGVVNADCQVFTGQGDEVHEGLYVCDGSVLPGALSVNPLLTISAIAERACQRLADSKGWKITWADTPARAPETAPKGDSSPPVAGEQINEESALSASSRLSGGLIHLASPLLTRIFHWAIARWPAYFSPGIQFTESMHGYITDKLAADRRSRRDRISNDFAIAFARGMVEDTRMTFDLTVYSDSVEHLATAPAHNAYIKGSVMARLLSEEPMQVINGEFRLFTPNPGRVETWDMCYDLLLARKGRSNVKFTGRKYLHQKPGSHYWADVTTLYTTVHDAESGELLVQGILELDISDVVEMSRKFELAPPSGRLISWLIGKFPVIEDKLNMVYMMKFAAFFGMKVFQAYGNLLSDLENFPARENAQRNQRPLRAPDPSVHPIRLRDGGRIKLTRYEGGERGPVVLVPGYSATSSSFAIDTVDENLVERLVREGYDVWLFAYRGSPDAGNTKLDFTIDDIALTDWPAAVDYIHRVTGRRMQVIAHCVGSMSLLMAILGAKHGEMDAIASVISSQLTLHPVSNWLNNLKSDLNVVPLLEKKVGAAVDLSADAVGPWDVAYWNIPVPEGEECNNPVCRRVFSLFGPSYTHGQLNHETHIAMKEMFGRIATKPGEQLTTILRTGYAVDAEGNNTYLGHVAKLNMPITFIAGELNQIFFPETSERTFSWLKAHNDRPEGYYDRHVIPGYAHMDLFIGKETGDFFDKLVAILDRQNKWMDH